MRTTVFILVLSVSMLGGCYTNVATDSSHYLPPEQSTAIVPTPVDATAAEIVRLFSNRGIVMVDSQPIAPAGTVMVRLAGLRGRVGHGNQSYVIGSAYYARIEPVASGSTLALVGKPTVDGAAPCTSGTGDAAQTTCPDVSIDSQYSSAVNGREEAAMIHSVLSELALTANQAAPSNSATTAANAAAVRADQAALDAAARQQAACLAQRHDIATRAQAIQDLDARGKVLQTMPDCGAASRTL